MERPTSQVGGGSGLLEAEAGVERGSDQWSYGGEGVGEKGGGGTASSKDEGMGWGRGGEGAG